MGSWLRNPYRRLDVFSGATLVAGIAGWVLILQHMTAHAFARGLPVWLFVLICLGASRMVVELNFGKSSAQGSLSDAAVLIGLYTVDVRIVAAAYIGAEFFTLWTSRRPQLSADFANFGALSCYTAVAVGVFQIWQPDTGSPFTPAAFAAGATAVLAGSLTNTLLYVAGSAFQELQIDLKPLGRIFLFQQLLTATCIPLGYIVVLFNVYQPWYAFLVIPVVGLMIGGQRAATTSAERAQRTEFLYHTANLLHSTLDLTEGAREVLEGVCRMFSVGMAELFIALEPINEETGDIKALRFRYTLMTGDFASETVDISDAERLLITSLSLANPAIRNGMPGDEALRTLAAERDCRSAAVGLIASTRRRWGMLGLYPRGSEAHKFKEQDLVLLKTVAGEMTVALERGKLDEALQTMAEEREELVQKGLHDALTGLGNRALFNDHLHQAWERWQRYKQPFAVLFIDLDGFKAVNDTLGHGAGDALLIGVAERLKQQIRKPDTAARFGGDEFALLLENMAHAEDATIVANRVVEALRPPFALPGGEGNVRGSVGVAVADSDVDLGTTEAQLLHRADTAMYAAKRNGKDQYVVYVPGETSDEEAAAAV